MQGLLECARLPYTGSSVLASALAMDKAAARRVFDQEDIASPRWCVYRGPADAARMGLPVVIKPSHEGSSVGISVVREAEALAPALALAGQKHGRILLEEYVVGREIQVAVLDGQALGEVEIRPATGFYDYAAKYERTDTQYLVPAPLSAAERQLVQGLARRAHRALGCAGVTRTDLILGDHGRAVCLEVDYPARSDRAQPGADDCGGGWAVVWSAMRADPRRGGAESLSLAGSPSPAESGRGAPALRRRRRGASGDLAPAG